MCILRPYSVLRSPSVRYPSKRNPLWPKSVPKHLFPLHVWLEEGRKTGRGGGEGPGRPSTLNHSGDLKTVKMLKSNWLWHFTKETLVFLRMVEDSIVLRLSSYAKLYNKWNYYRDTLVQCVHINMDENGYPFVSLSNPYRILSYFVLKLIRRRSTWRSRWYERKW